MDLRPWLADAQINTDRNLRLEYLAGMANNVYDAEIYQNMLGTGASWMRCSPVPLRIEEPRCAACRLPGETPARGRPVGRPKTE